MEVMKVKNLDEIMCGKFKANLKLLKQQIQQIKWAKMYEYIHVLLVNRSLFVKA